MFTFGIWSRIRRRTPQRVMERVFRAKLPKMRTADSDSLSLAWRYLMSPVKELEQMFGSLFEIYITNIAFTRSLSYIRPRKVEKWCLCLLVVNTGGFCVSISMLGGGHCCLDRGLEKKHQLWLWHHDTSISSVYDSNRCVTRLTSAWIYVIFEDVHEHFRKTANFLYNTDSISIIKQTIYPLYFTDL